MAGIWFTRRELTATLSEVVGYKAGLALNEGEIASHLGSEYQDLVLGNGDQIIRIRSEVADEVISHLLFAVGHTPVPYPVNAMHEVLRSIRKQKKGKKKEMEALKQFGEILLTEFKAHESKSGPFDPAGLFMRAMDAMGSEGFRLASIFVEAVQVSMQQSFWTSIRRIEWHDRQQLADLFNSESLETNHGQFIDQRFIDYLERNLPKIDSMNWRKFEGLAGEFFARQGFHVEMGPGRADGGIDARIWPSKDKRGEPPTILVQCKRQKTKVGEVVVKALWADIQEEKATSGLIVTTTSLSPGAEKVCSARAYPVHQANRETIKQWLEVMRTPNSGVFLGL